MLLLVLLHTTARPIDRDVVIGVVRSPLGPLVLGQVIGLVLDAQGDAGGCQGEEGEAGVAGTGGEQILLVSDVLILLLCVWMFLNFFVGVVQVVMEDAAAVLTGMHGWRRGACCSWRDP